MTLYDLPTGYGGFILYLLGGPKLVPAVGYMGGKRRLAPDIGEAMGVAPGLTPDHVVLADAGCPGWVWPELLDIRRAQHIAEVLLSWEHEGPVELWERLVKLPPAADPSERAAQVLWLQGRMATNCPLIWEDGCWLMGDKPRRSGKPSRQIAQLSGHVLGASTKCPFQRQRARGKGFNLAGAGGLLSTTSLARRVLTIARVLSRHRITFHHGDLFDVLGDARAGDLVYLDPDYQNCTSYGATVPRHRLLDTAEFLRAQGVTVAISEAVPLPLPGWWHVEITLPGGKPEWLTMSQTPVRRQTQLWRAA